MDGQTAGGGGLAGGGGPGDQDEPAAPSGDGPGDIGDGLVVQGLVDANEGAEFLLLQHAVDVGGVLHSQDGAPLLALVEDLHMLGPVDVGCMPRRILRVRGEDGHAPPRQMLHAEHLDIAGAGRHRAVEVLVHAAALIQIHKGHGAPPEQLHLVLLAVLFKAGDGVIQRPLPLVKGQIGLHNALHFRVDGRRIRRRQLAAQGVQIHAAAHAVLNAHPLPRHQPPEGQQRHKPQRALINAAALLVREGERTDFPLPGDDVGQLQHSPTLLNGQHPLHVHIQRAEALHDGHAALHVQRFLSTANIHTMPPIC